MTKTFDMIMGGLDEVESYLEGNDEGFVVHIPDEVDVKAIRQRLRLTQPKFAKTFGFSVGRIRDWEQKRYAIDAPSRVLLTVIGKEPAAVLRALSVEAPIKRGASNHRISTASKRAAPASRAKKQKSTAAFAD